MADTASDAARWNAARTVAVELAEHGVDPLDVQAAETARSALVRRFVLDLLLIFSIVAILAPLGLMLMRAIGGGDPIDGREIWIVSAALLLMLGIIAVRSFLPGRAPAYERAWAAFVEQVWPGAAKGDDLGRARLTFVRRAAAGGSGDFPSAAPGRRKA
ncbi:MAG TPA: hypothetical protein VK595_01625 [Vicinamibacterales bacterium]|nr:hypothetical protein [Vicinamibacterales bacterium]